MPTPAEPSDRTRPGDDELAHTGIVVVDHGSRRAESNEMLEAFVAMFRQATRYPIVEPAHMELAEPSIATAFARCVARGASRVVVAPYFLAPGRHWNKDIPALAAEAAADHPGVSYLVAAPIGLHPLMCDLIASRIDYCLSHVAGRVEACDVCRTTGKCQFQSAPTASTRA
ncbi:MAG: CbiX/SirB N-terminal domain-containing protein [Phycisphaeraceae bacterium]